MPVTQEARHLAVLGSGERPLTFTARAVALAAVSVVASDLLLSLTPLSRFAEGVLDEVAHFSTALVVLAAVRTQWPRGIAVGVLLSAVLIDLDHLPDELGHPLLGPAHGRPYSHTLLLPLALVVIALARRGSGRSVALAAAAGLLIHFGRDLCEQGPGASGAPVLWPFTTHAYALPYAPYLAALVIAVLAAMVRLQRAGRG